MSFRVLAAAVVTALTFAACSDAHLLADAAVSEDASSSDANGDSDGGSSDAEPSDAAAQDANVFIDAFVVDAEIDANVTVDANVAIDANVAMDANVATDANVTMDANVATDANVTMDANVAIDANVTMDANVAIDANVAVDECVLGTDTCTTSQHCVNVVDGTFTCHDAVDIAAMSEHSCVLFDEGSIKCWGNNVHGQLGLPGGSAPRSGAIALGAGRSATSVVGGLHHTCALLDDGSIKCWGDNTYGQLGTGDTMSLNAPNATPVDLDGRTATSIYAGSDHTCAILEDGTVTCWGRNSDGQLGYGDTTPRLLPSEVGVSIASAEIHAKTLVLGALHSCAVLDDASVMCWGANTWQQLGYGAGGGLPAPNGTDVLSGREAASVVAGHHHACALRVDGATECWGMHLFGTLGYGTTTARGAPNGEAVDFGDRVVVALASAGYHVCAMFDDASVTCWGMNNMGQLGISGEPSAPTDQTIDLRGRGL